MNDRANQRLGSLMNLCSSLPDPTNHYLGISGQLVGLPFQVLLFRRRPRTYARPDLHYRVVWITVLKGRGEILIDGVSHRVTQGQRILIRPFARHSYRDAGDGEALDCLFIGFETDSCRAINDLHGQIQNLAERDFDAIEELLSSYLGVISDGGQYQHCANFDCSQVVVQVAKMLESSLLDLGRGRALARSERLTEAQQIVENVWAYARNASPAPMLSTDGEAVLPQGESASSITRGVLARQLGVSESSLRDAILRFAHTSPRDFVRRIRLQRAGLWLMEHGFSVQEVARNAGYGEAAAFSNEFKKLMGVRPSVLIREQDVKDSG